MWAVAAILVWALDGTAAGTGTAQKKGDWGRGNSFPEIWVTQGRVGTEGTDL